MLPSAGRARSPKLTEPLSLEKGLQAAARRKATIALLLDRFHLTLEQYARLTDRQIFELYLHSRHADGSIDFAVPSRPDADDGEEDAPDTLESEMAALDKLAAAIHLPAAKREQLRSELRAKYDQLADA